MKFRQPQHAVESTYLIFKFVASWKEMKTTKLANGQKQLFSGMEYEIDCKNFAPDRRETVFRLAKNVSEDGIEQCLNSDGVTNYRNYLHGMTHRNNMTQHGLYQLPLGIGRLFSFLKRRVKRFCFQNIKRRQKGRMDVVTLEIYNQLNLYILQIIKQSYVSNIFLLLLMLVYVGRLSENDPAYQILSQEETVKNIMSDDEKDDDGDEE